jgi:3-deoxy-D-manno-octulosonic-acid transferase
MKSLYNLFVRLMIFGMNVFSLVSSKTKKGVRGRKQSLQIVKNAFSSEDKVLWMHASSLGEYEQGLPVLERLKEQFQDYKVLITFFSPSGYDNVKKRKHLADAVCYLPFDRKKDVQEFVGSFDCKIFFTVKYDYWYNLLSELKQKGTKNYVISALFYEHQIFFENYGKWFSKQLKNNIDWFFHQTIKSSALAKNIGLINSSVSGDTRFDRVKQFLERDNQLDFIENFKRKDKLLVFGSSWQTEEDIAQLLVKKLPETKFAIAPHDLHRIPHLLKLFPNAILYSALSGSPTLQDSNYQILIVDSIGKLSKLYSYADLAVVGGGFHSAGLHNILEAAVYGVPVIFGNQYQKNPEADDLIKAKGGKSFEDFVTAAAFIEEVMKTDLAAEEGSVSYLHEMAKNAGDFVKSQPNSTEIILKKMVSFDGN